MNLLSSLFGPPLPSLNAQELSEKLKNAKRPLVIDVRQPEEYRTGHIIGSKLIPLGELGQAYEGITKGQGNRLRMRIGESQSVCNEVAHPRRL